jgi:hypothetical protein
VIRLDTGSVSCATPKVSAFPSLDLRIGIAYGVDRSPHYMDKPRPYITAALLCEKVLQEGNGTISIIRLADRMGYQTAGMPAGVKPATIISGLVSLKSGPVTGNHVIKIFVENPIGKRTEVFTFPVTLMGKDHGQNIILNMTFGIEQDGLYWFDVAFDEEVLTRIPLMVVQEQTPTESRP